eukprot:1195986-Prorocentrum_minimum.AAC.6
MSSTWEPQMSELESTTSVPIRESSFLVVGIVHVTSICPLSKQSIDSPLQVSGTIMQVFGAIGNAIQHVLPGKRSREESDFKKIDGKVIAETITKEITADVADLKERTGKVWPLPDSYVAARFDSGEE